MSAHSPSNYDVALDASGDDTPPRKLNVLSNLLVVPFLLLCIAGMVRTIIVGQYDRTAWVLIPLGVLWVIWRVAVLVWRLTGRSNRAYNITMSVIMLGLWGLVGYGLAGNLDLRSRIEHISQAEQQINQRLAPQLREQEQLIDQLVKLSNQPRGVSYSDTPDKLLHVIDTLIEKQQALIDFDIVGAFREALSDRGFNESQLNQMASVNPIMIDMVRRERLLKAQLDLFRTIRQIHVIESAPPARFARQQRDELYVELDRLQAIVDALEQPPAPQAHPNGT